MNDNTNLKTKIIKWVVSLLAIANMVFLFVFNYNIPGLSGMFGRDTHTQESLYGETGNGNESINGMAGLVGSSTAMPAESGETEEKSTEEGEPASYQFYFDPETLTYDGQGSLNLLEGVSLVSDTGMESEAKIFASIVSGSSESEKTITYTADTESGRTEASRRLKLVGYEGPSIELPEVMPVVDDSTKDNILNLMTGNQSISADDGFGNDISGAVTAVYNTDSTTPRTLYYIFTVKNTFNDSAEASAEVTLELSKPVVMLSQKAVQIGVGEAFNPLSYVSYAIDTDGTSLSTSIQIQGTVDNYTAGTYTLNYIATNSSGVQSDPAELTVTVS